MILKLEDVYYHIRQPRKYKDFWELNQEFSYIEPFAKFKKRKNSAKIMMAIYMIYDPKSQLTNSGESTDKIRKDITKNFLEDDKFNWSLHKDVVLAYQHYTRTKVEKEFDDWWKQLEERKEFVKELDWEDDPDLKEKLLLQTDQHFEKFNNIVSIMKEERQEKLMYGDYTPSLLELWFLESV